MNRTGRVAATAATALLALSGLAGCSSAQDQPQSGSSDASSSTAPSTTSASTSPPTSESPSPSAGGSESSKPATITIKGFEYSGPSSVAPGSKITVTNGDSEAHTVTADEGDAFDVVVAGGGSKTFTAPEAGSYDFHCTYHGNMHGTLKVS